MNTNNYNKNILNCLGKIEFRFLGKRSLGSGSMIRTFKSPIVATAAHCIYDWDTQQFYEDLSFLLYSEGFKTSFKPILSVIPKLWAEEGAVEYDTGFLVLKSDILKEVNYSQVAIPVAFNIPRKLQYTIYGFRNVLFPSKKPYMSQGFAFPDYLKNSSLQGIQSKGKSGMSGGPWVTKYKGEYVQNSVSSLSMKSIRNTLWGPYWGNIIKSAYDFANDSNKESSNLLVHYY